MKRTLLTAALTLSLAAPAVGYDFDGDGHDDVLWRNSKNGAVAIWLMAQSTVKQVTVLGAAPLEWQVSTIGDIDKDGKADIIWRHKNGAIAFWMMDGVKIIRSIVPGVAAPEWEIQP